MGVGCYYRNDNGTRAFWIDLGSCDCYDEGITDCDCADFIYEDTVETIKELVETHKKLGKWDFYMEGRIPVIENGLYKIHIESTYYGDGLVFRQEVKEDYYDNLSGLGHANAEVSYAMIQRIMIKHFTLRMASSGYTSFEIKDEDAKKAS